MRGFLKIYGLREYTENMFELNLYIIMCAVYYIHFY